MTEADALVITQLIFEPIRVGGPLLLAYLDFRWLTEEQKARTWPDATYGMAALILGPLIVPIHLAMSRRTGPNWRWKLLWSSLAFIIGLVLVVVYVVALNAVLLVVEALG